MTQNNSGKNKPKNRRSLAKYPALKKKFNLKMRQDSIELDYINGVKNEDGEMVIRPLNDAEKKWYNAFIEETVNANFLHDPELRKLYDRFKELEKIEKPTQDQLEEYDYVRLLYYQLADDVLHYSDSEDQKKIYGENNSRNRCVYNRTKAAGLLIDIPVEEVDEEDEYSTYIDPDSGRNIYIDTVEYQRRSAIKARNKKEDEDNG